WVYKPSPTRKKEEAPPTQHSVLWARYTQSKGMVTAGETISNPVQVPASDNIISGTESAIPWTSVANSTMLNQVAHPPCSVNISSDQVVDTILSKTSEQHQIPSAESPETDNWNTAIQRERVFPYADAVNSNSAILQQNVSSNTALQKQVVDSPTIKQTTSIPDDTIKSCTVAQQTSFLSVESDNSTTSVTPGDSSSREDAGKEHSGTNLAGHHKSVGNNNGKESDSSVNDFNSDIKGSFKSISSHATLSWTSHVYTPERNCQDGFSKPGPSHIIDSSSTSVSGFQSEDSFISSNSSTDELVNSVRASDSSTQLTKSSSTEQSTASTDSTSQDGSSARSRSSFSSYRCSLTSSTNTFQQSVSSCNFTPTVSSSSNYSWDPSASNVMDDSCGGSKSEKSRQSSSKLILSKDTSSNVTLSSSFTKSAQSTTIASSRQELSSNLLPTPSIADISKSSFTLSKTDQSSDVSTHGQESSSSSSNSGVSLIQMNTQGYQKQNLSTVGQYSNIGALKQIQKIPTQEPIIEFDESEQQTHLDTSSSSGSLKRGKEYSLNITGQTKFKDNDIKTVTKVIPIGNTTRTISGVYTETSSLRRLLTATTLPSDLRSPESPSCDYVTVVDRSLVCNKQPVCGTSQNQPRNSKDMKPTNVTQFQATERKHSTPSKMSKRKVNKYDNKGNSRIMVKEKPFGKPGDGVGQMDSSHSSSLGFDTQSGKDDKIKYLYHGFLDPYDPFFYEGETLYSEYFPDTLEVDVTKWNQYLDGEEKEQQMKTDNLDTCFKSDHEIDSCHCSSDIDLIPVPLSTTLISGQTPDIRTSSDSNSSRSLNTGESLSQDTIFSPTPSSGTETTNETGSIEAFSNEEQCQSNRVSARNAFLRDHTYTEVVSNSSEPNIFRPKSISHDSYSSFTSLTNSKDESLGRQSTSCTLSTPSSEVRCQESCFKVKETVSDESWTFLTNINVSATPNRFTTLENSRRPSISNICSIDDGSALSDTHKCPSNYGINIANDFEMSNDTGDISLATILPNEQNTSYSETVNNTTRGTPIALKYSTEHTSSFPDTIIAPEYFDHLAAAVSSALKAVEDPFVGANTVEEELMKLDCTAPLLMSVQNICHQIDLNLRQHVVELNVEEERQMERRELCCSNVSDASELESIQFENVQPSEVMDGNKTLRVWKSADGKIVCQMMASPETMSKECWRIAPHVRSNNEENVIGKKTSLKLPVYSVGHHIAELENSCGLKAHADRVLKNEVEKNEEETYSEDFTAKCDGSDTFSHTSCEPAYKSNITPTDPSVTQFQSWGSSTCGNGQMLSEDSIGSSLSTSTDASRLFRPVSLKPSDVYIDLANTNDATVSTLDMCTSESALSRTFSEDGNSSSFYKNQEFHSNEDKSSNNVQCTSETERIRSVKEETSHAQGGGELEVEGDTRMAGVYADHELDSNGSQYDFNTNCNDQQFINIKPSHDMKTLLDDMTTLLEDNHCNALIVKEENTSIHDDDKSGASCSVEKKDRVSSPYKRRRSSNSVQVKKVTRRRFVL
ncbi:hypothetical protein ACJMK2_006306, partial [Sinanodonta woodiana]